MSINYDQNNSDQWKRGNIYRWNKARKKWWEEFKREKEIERRKNYYESVRGSDLGS